MNILLIKGDTVSDVRITKYCNFFIRHNISVDFLGWDRNKNTPQYSGVKCTYLISGGGFGNKMKLLLYYPLWMITLFFFICNNKARSNKVIIAVNFDSALPVYLASRLFGFDFIYEIRDEFAISYHFPKVLKIMIQAIDHKIMRKSKMVIHVDSNRVNYDKCRSVIIENSPEDYYSGRNRSYDMLELKFAVVGHLSEIRGLLQIAAFAEQHRNISLMIVGDFSSQKLKEKMLSLPNVEYFPFIPQNELFKKMESCCGIFSLYDPSLEINRLAASNKVYDAMMMGIPVITNHEVINSQFILDKKIGVVVDYDYNYTWEELSSIVFITQAMELGKNGRDIYLNNYQFNILLNNRLMPLLID